MPGALAIGVQPKGGFSEIAFGNQLMSAGFISSKVEKFITVAHDGFPLLFVQRL